MKPTVNLVLRKAKTTNGISGHVYLRLTISRKSKFYSLNTPVDPKYWDPIKTCVKSADPEYASKNEILDVYTTKARTIVHEMRISAFDVPVTFESFEAKFLSKKIVKLSQFVEFLIEERKNEIEQSTIFRYKSSIKKIREFDDISLSAINYAWIKGYEAHMRNNLAFGHNTVAKEIKWIKAMFSEAQRRGIISDSLKLDYTINFRDAHKDFLTINEVKTLILALHNPDFPENLKKVLYYFVFSCLTGLRISDIRNLNVQNFSEDFSFLDITTVKTKERIVLPLSAPARLLIKEYSEKYRRGSKSLPFFKVFSDQHSNIALGNIMIILGIHKQITYHNSRYTFATICNQLGVPIAVTARLLTHKTLRMTLQYAKFTDITLVQNIEKWDGLF